MPKRFAKQLAQVMRGAAAIGLDRRAALKLAIRCARDSMPPLRLAILLDVATNPHSLVGDVRQRIDKPRATVDRQLQALHILGVLACDEEEGTHRGRDVTRWRYRVRDGIDPAFLDPALAVPEKLPTRVTGLGREESGAGDVLLPNFSGTGIAGPNFSSADRSRDRDA
jgi:hypothetical protein